MNDIDARLARLEQQVQQLEDEREVTRLVLSYGPLVDSGSAEAVSELWAPEGVYDVDELFMTGRAQIESMVRSANHQSWIQGGCAHVLGPPHVTVVGDEATAVGYSLMVVHQDGRFVLRRATANLWRLNRGPDGWQVANRTNRVLDGSEESPRLLAAAFDRPTTGKRATR